MRAWPAPEVPAAARREARPLRLHDTATGRAAADRAGSDGPDVRLRHHAVRRDPPRPRRDLRRLRPGAAGPGATPAARSHYVQNVTDVDDPLLERAARDGEDWRGARRARDRPVPRGHGRARGSSRREHYVGAVEAIPLIVEAGRAAAGRGRGVRRRRRRLLRRRTPTRGFGAVERPRRAEMLRAVRASAAATPTGPARATRSTACSGGPARPGEPAWDGAARAAAGPGWHIECTAIALDHLGIGFDVQGGGTRPGLPAPRDGRVARRTSLTGERPFARHYVHAGHGRPRRREDVEVQGQPGLRLRAAARPAATRWRSGWRCSPTTTAPTGSGPTADLTRRGAAARALARRACRGRRRARRPTRCWTRGPRSGSADDLDAPGALAVVDALGRRSALAATAAPRPSGARRRRARAPVDAAARRPPLHRRQRSQLSGDVA